tara:strand:+ start:56 stop:1207 length:1152 start_codon:yes stop_codon:yes gene_type:complete
MKVKKNSKIMNMKIILLTLLILNTILSSAQSFINKSINFDGLTREYSIYIPSGYDGTSSYPLLFNFHGGNQDIASQQFISDMRPIADTANFIIVYPQARMDPSDGNSRNWLPKSPGTFDDVPFVSLLIDSIASNYLINQNRIYACGYSLGGDFTFELACKLSNKIAAIGVVARTMQANPESFCTPSHPTGVITILGTSDNNSLYDGITFNGIEYYLSAAATHAYWANYNNCDMDPTMNSVSPSVERYTWSTSEGCDYVEELKVIGGGHDWPGSFGNMTINSDIEIWQFVSRYDINGLMGCSTSSISENSDQLTLLKVYPNPIHDMLTIEISSLRDTTYELYTMIGELVISGELNSKLNTIDLSSLASNIYILKVNNKSLRIVK